MMFSMHVNHQILNNISLLFNTHISLSMLYYGFLCTGTGMGMGMSMGIGMRACDVLGDEDIAHEIGDVVLFEGGDA